MCIENIDLKKTLFVKDEFEVESRSVLAQFYEFSPVRSDMNMMSGMIWSFIFTAGDEY